ncbi:MAG: lipopolysaccharide biosynthesis protein [Burkholderiales bacterium]|jgi:hypothetical protein|nr:lipopolysaccharide biosynthesis protein [Burkholderiales bacterium]MBH2070780.1 lipopolysaccharide biosynthesis protein [Burkholderiales bacterium]
MENSRDIQDTNEYIDDGFNLTDFLASLWHARRLIICVTVATSVIGVGSALYSSSYKSEGFFQFGGKIPAQEILKEKDKDKILPSGIAIPDYKRYAAALNTNERFSQFVRQNNMQNNPDAMRLHRDFSSREGITNRIEPVYPFTKLDAKELGVDNTEGNNNVIGLRINYAAKKPEDAQRTVALLGRYTMDTIVYLIYSDMLRFKRAEISSKIIKLDNDIILSKEKLEKTLRKGEDLKKIVSRYPDAANQSARQVISVTEDNARFLSPVSQLMSTEVETSEIKEDIHKAQREKQQNLLLLEYYDGAKILTDGSKSGEAILHALEPLKTAVFKSKNLADDAVQEIYNRISIENQNSINLYLEKSRFIAGPSLPENRSARLTITLALSILAGLALSIFFVTVRNWSRNNILKLRD